MIANGWYWNWTDELKSPKFSDILLGFSFITNAKECITTKKEKKMAHQCRTIGKEEFNISGFEAELCSLTYL